MLSVSLGYVAQLAHMMAKFLELPLRYPINPMGSRSSLFDLVTDKLSDKEREYEKNNFFFSISAISFLEAFFIFD